MRFEAHSKDMRRWDELDLPPVTVELLQQARAKFRELVKGKSEQLGFTPNDWACRALREVGCPERMLKGFDLFALVHAVKAFKVRIDGKVFNEPYPVMGLRED